MGVQISQPVVSRVQIGEEAAGQRLDNYLFKRLKGVPKSRVYRMLREGELRVNGRRAQPDYRLELGDELRIPPVRTAVKPESENLPKIGKSLLGRVIYRDDSLLVLDKPWLAPALAAPPIPHKLLIINVLWMHPGCWAALDMPRSALAQFPLDMDVSG